jgi:hypothetical protein
VGARWSGGEGSGAPPERRNDPAPMTYNQRLAVLSSLYRLALKRAMEEETRDRARGRGEGRPLPSDVIASASVLHIDKRLRWWEQQESRAVGAPHRRSPQPQEQQDSRAVGAPR